MALDFAVLMKDVDQMPTVQAGLILALGRIRNEMEAFLRSEDWDGMEELLRDLDANSAVLADAVVHQTPAEEGHAARAARIQADED